MPSIDPAPLPGIRRRFARIMRVAAAVAIVVAAIAVLLVARGQSQLHVHMLIATALGIGLSVLMACGLMTFIFLSHHSGHDAAAGGSHYESDEQ